MTRMFGETVKYVCSHCNRVEYYTTFERICTFFILFFLATTSGIGVCAIVYVFHVGPDMIIQDLADTTFNNYVREHDMQLREYAIAATIKCDGDNIICYAGELYENITPIRYVPTSKYQNLYEPEYVLEHGGDCKNTAMLYVAMLHSLGFRQAFVSSNMSENHAIAVIPIDRKQYAREGKYGSYDKFVVDLTIPGMYFLTYNQSIWSYRDTISLYSDSKVINNNIRNSTIGQD